MEIESNPSIIQNQISQEDQHKILSFLNNFQPTINNNALKQQSLAQQNKIEIQQINEEFDQTYSNLVKVQYCHLYFYRLEKIRPLILDKIKILNSQVQIFEVLNTPVNKEVVVIGTFYKIMKQKPSVLDAKVATTNVFISTDFAINYCSEDDKYFIEDKTGRMEIDLSQAGWAESENSLKEFNKYQLMNGIIIGLIGMYTKKKSFQVKKIVLPGLPKNQQKLEDSQIKLLKEVNKLQHESRGQIVNSQTLQKYLETPHKDDEFIAIVSGLNINTKEVNPNLKLLQKFIVGNYDDAFYNISSKIQKLVIAGNSIDNFILNSHDQFSKQKEYQEIRENLNNSLAYLDSYIYELMNKISVDIMPGETEPCQRLWPQQHLNKCLFRKSYQLQNFNSMSNPYQCTYQNIQFLGTSGLNVKEMQVYTKNIQNEIDLLELNLHLDHIAPTAPDTLKCYPFVTSDPFILQELPHIYFTGNAEKFQTKLVTDKDNLQFCRLITCPNFSRTGSFVIINLRNLDAFEINFDISKN